MTTAEANPEGVSMSEVVKVSIADVERAQLVIRLNDYVGKPTPESIRKIAAAKPLNPPGRRTGS